MVAVNFISPSTQPLQLPLNSYTVACTGRQASPTTCIAFGISEVNMAPQYSIERSQRTCTLYM